MKITRFITLLTSLFMFCLLYFSHTNIDKLFFKTRNLQTTGDISLPSNFVNINNLFTLNFDFEPAGFIIMAIRFNIPGQYFAIGFGDQMTGTDMWIFQLINSQIVATDSIGIGHVPPPSDVSQGGTDNLETLGYEMTPTYSLVKVRRALNTGDPNDAVIQPGLTDLVYASGPSPTLVYHGLGGRGKVVVPLIAGTASTVEGSTDAGAGSVYEAHALANIIAWGLLVDIGIIIVRFFRGVKLRIFSLVIPIQFIHALLMIIIFCLSIVVTSLILAYNRRERGPNLTGETDIDFHFINGIIILFFLLLTTGLGIANLIVLGIYKRRTTPKFALKRFHSLSGIILYLCAKANIITGVMFHNEGHWRVPVYSYLFGLLLVQIGLEILYFYKVHVSNKPPPKKFKPSKRSMHLTLLEEINKGTPREEIIAKFPKVKWVMLGNRVYDLTGWIHPGGNAMIAAVIGREIGRYFYGNHVLEGTKIRPHKHSALTVSQMQSFCVGELTDLPSTLLLKNDGKETVSHSQHKWKIVKSTPITSTISEIRFQNPEIQVKNFGTSLSWLGRHYRVSRATKTSKARLYTTAFSLNEANVKLRQSIFKYFDEVMNDSEDPVFAYEDNYLTPQDSLPLYIKNYSTFPKSFSNKVHSTQIDHPKNEFRIEGPLGRGLELKPAGSGTHCIICGGTGILPFIDFLNLFLWKMLYDLIKQKGGVERAEKINLLNIPFDDILNGMNITFLGAFPNKNEMLGLDIIAKLAETSKKYEVNNFVAMIKGYSDENIIEVKESFSTGFLNKVLSTQEEKFYVVGPPKLNEAVPKALLELGVSKEKIMLV